MPSSMKIHLHTVRCSRSHTTINLPPPFQAANTVHVRNAERQKTRKGSRDGRSTEEKCLAELRFMTTIPHGNIVSNLFASSISMFSMFRV
jgi:hypothetical protein